ncbi:MAG TPA: periplasmic heavy metal sensor [Candidatus Acidoferrum sp.]|nr:periplasmic heavy metal sensor [Candidatus Acidoferrum sp.]
MVTKIRKRDCGWLVMSVLIIIGVVAGGATGVGAQQQQTPLPTLEQLRWNEIQQKLGLTPEQVTTLQGILAANRTTMHNDFQALRTAHQGLRTAWNQADAGAISAAAGQVQTAQNKLFNDRVQGQLQVLNALGPDLFKQWTALHKPHRHGGRGFGGFGMGM